MNPTAEDILKKKILEFAKSQGISEDEALGDFKEFLDSSDAPIIFAAMEEYSLLKSKEAADKAWEASRDYEHPSIFGKLPPNKETFMKELFK